MTRVMSCRTVIVMVSALSAFLLSQTRSEPAARSVAADPGPTTATTAVTSGPAPVSGRIRHSRCNTSELRVRAGREGGGSFGYASVTAQFTNTADGPCRLPVRFRVGRRATLRPVVVPARQRWGVSMDLSWSNWCGARLGPLTIKVRFPHRGQVTGSFDGPPAYNFVPGCVDKQRPSKLVLLYAYERTVE
jgi:hypothetical protein